MLVITDLDCQQGNYRLQGSALAHAGELVGVFGPSGSGKSTLLSAMGGFIPYAGHITWQGQRLQGSPGERAVSSLFQTHNLFMHLTVAQNIGLGLGPYPPSATQQLQIHRVAQELGISQYLALRPEALSGGEQQRVALARILLRQQPLVLLDEPFSALDPAWRQQLLQDWAQLAARQGWCVVVVSHQPEEIKAVAQRCWSVVAGQLSLLEA